MKKFIIILLSFFFLIKANAEVERNIYEKIDLFGKPALTTTLPAQLSIKYNLRIVPVFIERINDNRFEINFQNEIDPNDFKNKLDLSKKLNSILEKMIIKNPAQWIWSHNRWK